MISDPADDPAARLRQATVDIARGVVWAMEARDLDSDQYRDLLPSYRLLCRYLARHDSTEGSP